MKNVRVFYNKTGMLKYVSHLDMNRAFARIIKRSGIPAWYTEGFNPHAKLNFALPLSVGFESTSEAVDIRIADDSYTCESVFRNLNRVMPEGLEVKRVSDPVMKTSDIRYAKFELTLRGEYELDGFFSRSSITVNKKTKSGVKPVDIKPMIKEYSLNGNTLCLVLSAGETNLNPTLVIDAAEQYIGRNILIERAVRTDIYNGEMLSFC